MTTTLEPGRPVEGVFAVRRKERRMSRKGSPYLALTLGDATGTIAALAYWSAQAITTQYLKSPGPLMHA